MTSDLISRKVSLAIVTATVWWAAGCARVQGQPAPGVIEVFAGGGTAVEGRPAAECRVTQPFGIAFSPRDDTFICEETHRILRIDGRTGLLSVMAAARPAGSPLGDGGPVGQATFAAPHCLVADAAGNLYIADTGHRRVRRIDAATGIVTTFAGNGTKEFTGDGGPAAEAGLDGVACVCFSPDHRRLYLGGFSRAIREVDMASGIIRTVAGTGGSRAFAVDSQGRLFVPTPRGLRVFAADGTATVLEDPAADPPLRAVKHLWPDAAGDILIADEATHLIRRFLVSDRRLTTVAGTGEKGMAGVPGDPLAARLGGPHGVVVHPRSGEIYIADSRNDRVLRIRTKPGQPPR